MNKNSNGFNHVKTNKKCLKIKEGTLISLVRTWRKTVSAAKYLTSNKNIKTYNPVRGTVFFLFIDLRLL